ncbi:MAG TPA: HEAT repeat domain-containing protein, partial [Spirochaetota bacterium]|nr:HEAT repeat domain-containing protein [Spirochaetota bacterium]
IYASPFIVEFARNGAVKKVHFPSDIAPDDEKDIAAIIRQMQFVIKKSITSAWHTRENDSAGSYEAEYLYDKISLKKRKTGYAEITDREGHANGEITAAVRESRAEIFYGKPFTWLRRSSGRDKVTFFYSEDSYITSSVTFSAKKAKFRPGEKLAIWKEAGTFKKILADWRSKPKNRHSFADMLKLAELRKAYGTVSFNSVAEPMLLKNSGEETEKGIAGYLALFPEDSMKLAGLVASGRLTSGQNSTAINSLARVGHAEAQGALVRIMNDAARAERVRILSAGAIATLAQPVPATIEGLWNAYHKRAPENQSGLNVAGSAVLTLGALSRNMARSYREDLQNTAEDIREKIISELSNEGPMTPALISAAGETGHDDAIDAIEDELDSDNPRYRSAAIASIKDFEDPGVNGILIKRLRKEDNPGVRAALV